MLEILDLKKCYGAHEVLKGITLSCAEASVTAVLGTNGSGKSTLMRCLNLLEPYEYGEIRLKGEPLSRGTLMPGYARPDAAQLREIRHSIGMVMQALHLFPHLSVLDNVMIGPRKVLGKSAGESAAIAEKVLRHFSLWEKHAQNPTTLSGGQKQRVAIARALAADPQVLLLDEPTSALDPLRTREVLEVISDLRSSGMTMVVVTHDLDFARDVADTICFLENGTMVYNGPPKPFFDAPPSQSIQQFLGR